jgi:hypothetical protein
MARFILPIAGFGLLVVVLLFLHAPRLETGFVVPLDFAEVDRALGLDHDDPARIWNEPHAGFGYRPITQFVHFLTVEAGDGSAQAFLIRNLASHVVSSGLVMLLGTMLLRSWVAGLVVASFFALHPASVSVVSVPVYHAYGLIVPLLAVTLGLYYLQRLEKRPIWAISFAVMLVSIAPWMSENGLWLLAPVTAMAIWLRAVRDPSWLFVAAIPWLSALVFLFVRNQIVNIADQVLLVQDVATYGLKSPSVIAFNMVMYQIGAAMPFDYLLGMDPLVQGFSRGNLLGSTFGISVVVISAGAALALAMAIYAALTWLWLRSKRSKRRDLVIVATGMITLFWFSSILKLVFAQSTEMYVYEGSPWWMLGVAAVLVAAVSEMPEHVQTVAKRASVVLFILILGGYGFATYVRINVLVEKAQRLEAPAHMAASVWEVAGQDELDIAIVISCDVPFGFSVYGLNRGSALLGDHYKNVSFGEQGRRVVTYRAGRISTRMLAEYDDRVFYVDEAMRTIRSADAAIGEDARCKTF